MNFLATDETRIEHGEKQFKPADQLVALPVAKTLPGNRNIGGMTTIPKDTIKKALPLPDGGSIVLVDMFNYTHEQPDAQVSYNVYRLAGDGRILWQISAAPPVRPWTPFTNIYYAEGDRLMAFRFDCYEHEVDFETGQSVVHDYLK